MGGTANEVRASDGTVLHVASDGGVGPPVVLLHGLACDATMWAPVAERLRPDRRVVVVDLRGHGRSQPVAGGFGLAQQADDVRAVLDALDLYDVTLVGHSAGGYAALAFASAATDRRHAATVRRRLRALVTVGTSGSLTGPRARAVLRASASQPFVALLGVPAVGRRIVGAGAFGSRPDPRAVEHTRAMARRCPRATKVAWVSAISGTSLEAAVQDLPVPLVAATGSRDSTVPPSHAARLAARAPNGRAHVLRGLGHLAPLEDPAAVAGLVGA